MRHAGDCSLFQLNVLLVMLKLTLVLYNFELSVTCNFSVVDGCDRQNAEVVQGGLATHRQKNWPHE